MDCPNCKGTMENRIVDNAEFFHCEKCGWFRIDHDGAWVQCPQPKEPEAMPTQAELEPLQEPSEPEAGRSFIRISII